MANVKIMNPVEGETSEQRIKRCANNLLKALLAGGYDVRKTEAISGFDVNIYNHTRHMTVNNVACRWAVECGWPTVKIEFADMYPKQKPEYEPTTLKEDAPNAD